MDLSLFADGPLSGTAELPGDKSLSHRAALFATLAEGESVIEHFLDAGVTRAMLAALKRLDVPWWLTDDCLTLKGQGYRSLRSCAGRPLVIPCRNSATTLRLLAGMAAGTGTVCVLDGSEGLRKRPMDRILEPLRRMGCPVESEDGFAPLTFRSQRGLTLKPIRYALPVASAQVKSCLVLAALGIEGETVLTEPGPSRDHTERMLRAMGAPVETEPGNTLRVRGLSESLSPLHVRLPGDLSSAAFLLAAAACRPGSSILLKEVGVNPTRTGFLDVLAAMGAPAELSNEHEVCGEPVADIRFEARPLHGAEISDDLVVRMIDEFPAFATLACAAEGVSRVRGASELRYKESDRISSLCAELRRLGARIEEAPDGFTVEGGPLAGGEADARGDHRLAMALALAGLFAKDGVTVHGAEIIEESFPDFTVALEELGVSSC